MSLYGLTGGHAALCTELAKGSFTLASICFSPLGAAGRDHVAKNLTDVLATVPFPHVRRLGLELYTAFACLPKLFRKKGKIPVLTSSRWPKNCPGYDTPNKSVSAVRASGSGHAPHPHLRQHRDRRRRSSRVTPTLRLYPLTNLQGWSRLEIAMVPKEDLMGETGLALLDKCKEWSISLRCRYGYL